MNFNLLAKSLGLTPPVPFPSHFVTYANFDYIGPQPAESYYLPDEREFIPKVGTCIKNAWILRSRIVSSYRIF